MVVWLCVSHSISCGYDLTRSNCVGGWWHRNFLDLNDKFLHMNRMPLSDIECRKKKSSRVLNFKHFQFKKMLNSIWTIENCYNNPIFHYIQYFIQLTLIHSRIHFMTIGLICLPSLFFYISCGPSVLLPGTYALFSLWYGAICVWIYARWRKKSNFKFW